MTAQGPNPRAVESVLPIENGPAIDGLKIYDEARSAHLERLYQTGRRQQLIYRTRSYDFDELLDPEKRAIRLTVSGTIRAIMTMPGRVIELNEPLFVRALPRTCLYCFAAGISNRFRKRRIGIICYAIENIDFAEKIRSHLGAFFPLAWPLVKWVIRHLVGRFDRVAFGTQAAFEEYARLFSKETGRLNKIVIPPLEPRCASCAALSKQPRSLLFVGALDDRKGIRELMAAWPGLARRVPGASLCIIGKGPLEEDVRAWAVGRREVSIISDPPRTVIHEVMARAHCLILASRSSAKWREQVGLPIVEALSHGCRIISSRETGLASWLEEHGHLIIDDPIVDVKKMAVLLSAEPDPAAVLQSLPQESGRVAAEDWLWQMS